MQPSCLKIIFCHTWGWKLLLYDYGRGVEDTFHFYPQCTRPFEFLQILIILQPWGYSTHLLLEVSSVSQLISDWVSVSASVCPIHKPLLSFLNFCVFLGAVERGVAEVYSIQITLLYFNKKKFCHMFWSSFYDLKKNLGVFLKIIVYLNCVDQ